jgi:hypothetical protein
VQETRGYAAFTISFTFDQGSSEIDLNGCLYRKLKPARIDGEVRQGQAVT